MNITHLYQQQKVSNQFNQLIRLINVA